MGEIVDIFHAYSSVNGKEVSLIQTAEKFNVSTTNFVQLMCRFFFQLGEEAVCFRYRVLQNRLSEAEEAPRNLWEKSAQELDCILEEYLEDEI